MFKKQNHNFINLAEVYKKGEALANKIPPIKKRREKKKLFKIFKYSACFFAVIFLILIFLAGAFLFQFKNVYSLSIAGKRNLDMAVAQIGYQNFAEAVKFSETAESNFNLANQKLFGIKSKPIVSNVKFLEEQVNNLEYLTMTAELLSKAMSQGALLGREFVSLVDRPDHFNFSKFSKEEKRNVLKLLYESGPELNGLKANVSLAYLNLKQFDESGLFFPIRNKIYEFESNLLLASEMLEKAVPLSEMIPALAGYPEKSTFLVMLQNNDELRPSGGFLGTYGILEIDSGDILRFDTHDIYHMDMPVKDLINIEPPEPIKQYLNQKWYMRDANWYPDWPTSAQKIQWFYHLEDNLLPPQNQINNFNGDFEGIIGITPEFVTSLLNMVGPIEIEGELYTPENFTELLEYRVQRGFVDLGVPRWHRKEVIGDISKEIKIRLFDLPVKNWKEIFYLINDNIQKKDLLVYLNDSQFQALSKEFGWAGEIKDVQGDYLMVVDANLAAYKTDAVMGKSLSYNLEQSANGLFAKLNINYAHYGGFDWRTTRYQSYTRIYVPEGSTLIKAEGFTSEKIDVINEFGKTYFGGFLSVEPGAIKNIYLEYKLPEKLNETIQAGAYELYVQKQPGNKTNELVVDLKMKNDIKSYWPHSFFARAKNKSEISWKTDLSADKIFLLDF